MHSRNSRRIRRSHPTPSPRIATAVGDMKVVTTADMVAVGGNPANDSKKGGPNQVRPLILRQHAYGCVAGTSLTLCASPAASIVAPIIAGKPMQEFSMS
jgi:hypothetical protein